MCGILGRINFNGEEISKENLAAAAHLINHRGPDKAAQWSEKGCGLAHQRLSVIDLTEHGDQPMESNNGRYVCVFNGEIYNFLELRKDIQANWQGTSDTEVLVEGWALWGEALLDKIDGMFAFAIWDKETRKLFIARDRMGEKPLYYHWANKTFAFSSRPKPIFKVMKNLSLDYDHQGLRFYLESGYIPAPYTAHKELKKLPAAHYLTVDESGLEIKRYWDFSQIPTDNSYLHKSEESILEELDAIVTNSVKQRMISDVPLGAFLSGGIDSSLMVAIMSKLHSQPIKTFTIGFEEKAYDESNDAQAVANYLKTDHHCEQLKVNDLLELVPTFLENYDEPFFDSAAFPTLAVSRLARKHVTVSITGDGGDELFGGYHYYKISKALNPFFSMPKFVRMALSSTIGVVPKHKAQLLSAALKQNSSARAFAFSRSIAKDFRNIMPADVLSQTQSLGELFELTSASFPPKLHASEEGMRLDALYTLNDDYLQKTDVASMAYSLESRSPLLAREVVEWSVKLPVKWKVQGVSNKYLLRKLAYKYIPREILDRPKRGFGVPIDSWLRGPLKGWANEKINNKENFQGLPLEQNAVQELFKLHDSGFRNVHPLLWAILMLLEFNTRTKSHLNDI
jgi:asparagine synthase (glutamine-hydrolysing)